MKNITPIRTFYLQSGRVILSKTKDQYPIESTEMRDISVDGKLHSEVRNSLDPHVIWKHSVNIQDKWLCTVSTQKGCVHNCKFCDVASLPFKGNLTFDEIVEQIEMLISSTPEVNSLGTKKAKIGFARMGEPAHNLYNVLDVIRFITQMKNNIKWLPCFNSILPRKTLLGMTGQDIIKEVLNIKEELLNGFLHFQISCNSTDEEKRKELFGGADVISLEEVINSVNSYPKITNRTVTLNFIVMKDVPIDIKYLMKLGLNPKRFAVKLIPLNTTINSKNNNLETQYDYNTYEELQKYAAEFERSGIPVVYDAVAKCEAAGLCCGQLAHIFG